MLQSLLIDRQNFDDTAVIGNGREISYRELAERAQGIRRLLPQGPPENIAIFLPNGAEYISAFFAVIMSGMVAFPMNASMTRHEALPLLRQASVRTLITSKKYIGLFDGVLGLSIVDAEGAKGPLHAPAEKAAPDAPMVLLGTSGTTGKSKIVMLSQRNVEASLFGYMDKMSFGEEGGLRFILAAPFASAYGIMVLSACLMQSYPLVLIEGAFTLDAFFQTACAHRVTNYEGGALPVQMMEWMAGRPIPYDISRLKYFGFGGSKIPGSIIDKVIQAYPGIGFYQGYGMTEASPLITKHPHGRFQKPDSVGSAIQGVEIAIEADGVLEGAPGATGEILVKGQNVMLGYYQNEEETNKTIKNGYLYTGDIGYLDEDGYLFICGRKKNIIIVGGLTVYPEEVEACMMESQLIHDCHVYGQPDGAGSEKVCADVTPAAPGVTAEDIMDWCAARLAGYKQPRQVAICDAIKKSAAGKTERAKRE